MISVDSESILKPSVEGNRNYLPQTSFFKTNLSISQATIKPQ